ncbi:glycine--tRNA ligase subunit beta [Sphingomonas mesophila]|uniref:glycine--tRNA ligase subunit beta n=1 Tax=Sphingomonas mesophila TaxID=2303576 RepID=UPI00196786C2|nr:glycine--tRNA ligase subunit beta [Sphingomonas mesophila]
MSDFLLELLSEEVPARMQGRARGDLARLLAEGLAAAGLSHEGIATYSTPRRLAAIVRGLPTATEASAEELKGPRTSAPEQALEGFLRKTGLGRDQLEERDGVWFARIERPGRATAEVLAELVAGIVRDFPWPKSMRWGDASASSASLRWVRPLHSIVALLGEEIVPVAIAGVACGAATLGHRFHHPGPITIGGAHDYAEKLRACHVIIDQEEREAIIREGARQLAEDAGYVLVADEGLVVENAGLTEWPVPLLGSFDSDFLDVPEEVIQLTARLNQKYFVMRGGDGRLAPFFVLVANVDAEGSGDSICAGNSRVLAARLSDARFFWQQDMKVPLEEQAAKLGAIVFHEKLGTVADKVERVAKLAEWLASEKIVPGCDPSLARRAAQLCKADLVTGMVGEFPELQGVIGGHLARAQGEPDAIAGAIRDHYKPVGQGDEVPTAPVTVAVSLADKLDSIASFFLIDERPTGSKDPFALRRAALGILRVVIDGQLRLPALTYLQMASVTALDQIHPVELDQRLCDITRNALKELDELDRELGLPSDIVEPLSADLAEQARSYLDRPDGSVDAQELFAFLIDRLKVQQREAGVRHDLIDAVFALGGEDDLVRLLARVTALQAFVETGEGADLLAGYKRAANILKKEEGTWTPDQARGDGDMLPEEAALVSALDAAAPTAKAAVEAEDFTGAMAALASLRGPIDAFFEKVTVNAEDAGVRARRLGLLQRFRDAVHTVADFSRIEG